MKTMKKILENIGYGHLIVFSLIVGCILNAPTNDPLTEVSTQLMIAFPTFIGLTIVYELLKSKK